LLSGWRPKSPSAHPSPAVTIAIEKRPSATSISSATSSTVASKNSVSSSANSAVARRV
jgi:hypothetical protein